jgi:RHS repeat-associated protein
MRTFLVNETSENVWFDQFSILTTTPVILQETHYDPWGVELQGLGYQQAGIKANKYLYNGKEFNDHLGINLSDYGARMYDASIGRWFVVDPLAEKYIAYSPYIYSLNNPVRYVDPNGKEVKDGVKTTTIVTSQMDKYKRLHVTTTTTTTSVKVNKSGSIESSISRSKVTNIISSDPNKSTEKGDVVTTSQNFVDGNQIGETSSTISSQEDFGGDLSLSNSTTQALEKFRNDTGIQFNEYVIGNGSNAMGKIAGLGTLPFGVSGLGIKLPEKIASIFGSLGVPTSVGEVHNQVIPFAIDLQSPLILNIGKSFGAGTQRRNPKEGVVEKGHQILYDVVFGWWLK